MMAFDFCLIYTTLPDTKAAENLARHLLSLKLIACANLLPEMRSFYEWKDKLTQDSECVLLLKTRKSLYKKVEREIQSKHPYECPCILQLSITSGGEAFLKWVQDSVSQG